MQISFMQKYFLVVKEKGLLEHANLLLKVQTFKQAFKLIYVPQQHGFSFLL